LAGHDGQGGFVSHAAEPWVVTYAGFVEGLIEQALDVVVVADTQW
jgi:hypothetical protein